MSNRLNRMLHKNPAFATALKCCKLWLGRISESTWKTLTPFTMKTYMTTITDIVAIKFGLDHYLGSCIILIIITFYEPTSWLMMYASGAVKGMFGSILR